MEIINYLLMISVGGIMSPSIRQALLSMGYYEQEPQKWAKPIGFHLFTYDEKTSFWQNWFVGITDQKVYLMDKKELKEDEHILLNIKHFECFSKHDVCNVNSKLELSRRYDI